MAIRVQDVPNIRDEAADMLDEAANSLLIEGVILAPEDRPGVNSKIRNMLTSPIEQDPAVIEAIQFVKDHPATATGETPGGETDKKADPFSTLVVPKSPA